MIKSLFENAPKIIEAAKSPLGIVALVVLVLSVVAVIFFRTDPVEYRVAAFMALFVGFGLFVRAIFRKGGGITSQNRPQIVAKEAGESSLRQNARTMLDRGRKSYFAGRQDDAVSAYEQARALFKQAGDRLCEAVALLGLGHSRTLLGRHDAARNVYGEARTLYKQEQDRLGEANVLSGLGDLESKLGRNDAARDAYGEARTLFKQVEDRLGEANVLRGLGSLEKDGNPELAKRHLFQAAHIYQDIGLPDWERRALEEAEAIGR